MRHILYCLLLIAVAGSSCHKQVLDIDAENLLSGDLAFSTPEKIEAVTLAAYDGLQKDFLASRALIYIDLMGNDIFDRNGTLFGELPRFNMLANNAIPASVWSAGYDAIGRANRAIVGITANSSKLTAAKASAFIAECKFVRAVANFYLVNFFGQPYNFTADASHPGIPLITDSYTYNDPAANKPRSTVAEVYAAIVKDLTEALADLPLTYSGYTNNTYHTKTRGTKAAASAFLSRVYLYKGDYANAKKYAEDVINKAYGTFALNSTVNGAFNKGNYTTSETIWSIPNNATDNPNTNGALPMHYYPSDTRGDLPLSKTFQDLATNPYFAIDDKRRGMIISGITSQTAPFKWTTKYTDVATRADWAPVIRYAEVLLTYAEAQARTATGADADAIAKLNEVRDRARVSSPSYTAISFNNDKDKLIEAIFEERRIELAFEGHRFWDMMRVKATVTGKYDNNGTSLLPPQPFGANKNIFPIPQLEVDKSKKVLVQNPGYE
jgi:starch-binding outer membrane protein, SusD/RagB family